MVLQRFPRHYSYCKILRIFGIPGHSQRFPSRGVETVAGKLVVVVKDTGESIVTT